MAKTNPGRFFEDFVVGDVIHHAVPRTVSGGERALYPTAQYAFCIVWGVDHAG